MIRFTRGLLALMASFAVFLSAQTALADDVKIGVVDLRKVLQESAPAKQASQKLEKQFKPRQEKLFTMQKQLKADAEKLRKDATLLTAAQKSALQDKISREQRELEQAGTNYQQDLNQAQSKAMQAFLDKVKVALDKLAAKDGYDIVLQKENVPYSSAKMDITKQLIAALK